MRSLACILLVLCGTTILTAQEKAAAERVLVSDERYVVSYRVTASEIVFTMEDLRAAETGEDWKLELPGSYFSVYVDVDRNARIDPNVDVSYGVYRNGLSLCAQYLIDERSSTTCGALNSGAYYEKSSRRTANSPLKHVVHRFTVPRSELAKPNATEINVTFHCVTEGDPFWATTSFYPASESEGAHSFAKTLRLRL